MTAAWSDADVALLIEWVGMTASLYANGAPDDASVIAALASQMQLDLADRDDAGIKRLIQGWAPAMHQAAVEIRQAMR